MLASLHSLPKADLYRLNISYQLSPTISVLWNGSAVGIENVTKPPQHPMATAKDNLHAVENTSGKKLAVFEHK